MIGYILLLSALLSSCRQRQSLNSLITPTIVPLSTLTFTPTSTLSLVSTPSFTLVPTPTAISKILYPENGHWYQMFSSIGKDWTSARDYCVTLNGHLVTIGSKYEEDFVYNNLSPYGSYAFSWLGLTDSVQEGNWQWVTGEPLIYTNWHSGQPDSCDMVCESMPYMSEKVDYAIFNNMSHDWDDWGTDYIYFICEWENPK